MDKKINMSDLALLLAGRADISRNKSEELLKAFFDQILEALEQEGTVKIKGLGTFKLVEIESRESMNVNSGERFVIEGHRRVAFVPDAALRDLVNKPFEMFEAVELPDEPVADTDTADDDTPQEPAPVEVEEEQPAPQETADTPLPDEPAADDDTPQEPASVEVEEEQPAPQETAADTPLPDEPATDTRVQKKKRQRIIGFLLVCLLLFINIYLFLRHQEPEEPIATTPQSQTAAVVGNDSIKADSIKKSTADSLAAHRADSLASARAATQPQAASREPEQGQPAPAPSPAAQEKSEPPFCTVALTADDQAKEIKRFTLADTLNYRIDGVLCNHTVLADETIVRIAQRYYGTKKLWPYIAACNGIKRPNDLCKGMQLKIPILKAK